MNLYSRRNETGLVWDQQEPADQVKLQANIDPKRLFPVMTFFAWRDGKAGGTSHLV
jgi:hypothetical protein